MLKRFIQILLLFFCVMHLQAQDSGLPAEQADSLQQLPAAYLDNVSSKANQLQQKIDDKSAKAVEQLIKQENKIKRKLSKIDSLKAAAIFGNAEQQYQNLNSRLQNGNEIRQYIPTLDTLVTSLKFIQQNPQLLSSVKNGDKKLKDALTKIDGLENQLQKADELKKWMRERRQYLKEQLQNLGFAKELKRINKEAFYYNEQLNGYKEVLKDHKKAERKAFELLSKTKLFQKFMRRHSMLASLFRLPGDADDPSTAVANLAGLQTRSSVNALIQNQLASGGPNAQQQLQQNLSEAHNKINELKNKITQLGGGSSDDEIPEGFHKNGQRGKNFWKKWEAGINIQSNRSNRVFPVSSDLGLSVGFRPHDNFVVGLGLAGRIGWGKSIRHIALSYSGIGVRSFAEIKIKSSFHAAFGYEMNYRPEIRDIEELKDKSGWQAAGLVGLSKVLSLKTKFFKRAKLSLLWDCLSYTQVPRTKPLVFRIGYSL